MRSSLRHARVDQLCFPLVARRAAASLFALLISTLASHADAEPKCVTSNGKTACGYECMATEGQVRCAQVPQGVCAAGSGMLVCWDPPAVLRSLLGTAALQRPSCLISSGHAACGYSCVANYDTVQCAQTPFGACSANEGKVVCWDPAAAIILAMRDRTPRATCLANYGKVACGYHCVANYGLVRCAQTPEGICRSEFETVTCWDPPLESRGVVFDPAAELACLDAGYERTCGYRCLATRKSAACGSSRKETCRVEDDAVRCAAP